MAKNKKKASAPAKDNKAVEKEVPAYAAKKKEAPKKDKKAEKETKSGFMTNFKEFWKGLFKELKKINWSSAKDTFKNFLVVLLVILVIGIGVWVFDALFVKIRELIYNYSPADAEAAVILLKAQIGLL